MHPLRIRGLPPQTIWQLSKRPTFESGPLHVFLCIADHWEPKWARPSRAIETERVDRWVREYPTLAERFTDSLGRPPRHSFFYPEEEYEPEHLDKLAELCRRGFGDVEIHLHHDNDTSEGTREKLCRFRDTLHQRHGLLQKDEHGNVCYAFIHGNWALDNSRPDGRWCGVNDEISILIETGCYADLTMPSAPDPCQTKTINQIYFAQDDPRKPKSHDQGVRCRVGGQAPPDSLLMIQGPLALDWGRRKWGVLPRLENGDLTGHHPPTLDRLKLWLAAGVTVQGRPDWRFVKLHTHGTQDANAAMLLGEPIRRFHADLAGWADRGGHRYYYATPWEMSALTLAASQGETDPALVLGSASGGSRE